MIVPHGCTPPRFTCSERHAGVTYVYTGLLTLRNLHSCFVISHAHLSIFTVHPFSLPYLPDSLPARFHSLPSLPSPSNHSHHLQRPSPNPQWLPPIYTHTVPLGPPPPPASPPSPPPPPPLPSIPAPTDKISSFYTWKLLLSDEGGTKRGTKEGSRRASRRGTKEGPRRGFKRGAHQKQPRRRRLGRQRARLGGLGSPLAMPLAPVFPLASP